MDKIVLPIDTKSLYYNILNDNATGHTCTVATPIRQGNSVNLKLTEVYKINSKVDFQKHADLIRELIKNSKSVVKINEVYLFDNLKVNGKIIDVDAAFCFYTKEEIDKERAQFGRIKLHYPSTLKYAPLNIDNRKIINTISEMVYHMAFLVESFEYCFDDNSLNFNVLLVGYSNIPYSKVFTNNKGVGNKYKQIKNNYDYYDMEIIPIRQKHGFDISVDSYYEYIDKAKLKAKELICEFLVNNKAERIKDFSSEYPYALYDFQYYLDERIHYALVFGTYTKIEYFLLTINQNRFIHLFDDVNVFLVRDIDGKEEINQYSKNNFEDFSVIMDVIKYIK